MCGFEYLAHYGFLFLSHLVDSPFAFEMADKDDCYVPERRWVRDRFDRRKSSDPVRSSLFLYPFSPL
jgi:hypothetical protein